MYTYIIIICLDLLPDSHTVIAFFSFFFKSDRSLSASLFFPICIKYILYRYICAPEYTRYCGFHSRRRRRRSRRTAAVSYILNSSSSHSLISFITTLVVLKTSRVRHEKRDRRRRTASFTPFRIKQYKLSFDTNR